MPSSLNEIRQSQKIAGWARCYAQNRSLGVVVNLLIFLVLNAGIGIPSYVGGIAYRSGNLPLFWVCLATVTVFSIALLYMSVPQWGGRKLEALSSHLYGEGNVSIAIPHPERRRNIGIALGATFGVCVLTSVLLGVLGLVPERFMQPVSALYCVPFLVGVVLLSRPAISDVMLLWPALYALHAILIVAGYPIVFTGPWETLNILIPMSGYGIIAALISHAFNRLALHNMRRLTHADNVVRREADEGRAE
jgi:hypothetical protein